MVTQRSFGFMLKLRGERPPALGAFSNPTQPNPTQPNPTQPNPTQPNPTKNVFTLVIQYRRRLV